MIATARGIMRRAVWLAAALLASAPGLALACPVCFSPKDDANRVAFLGTAVMLTALPVVMISGLIYWIAKRAHDLDREERAERRAAAAASHGSAEPAAAREHEGELVPLRRG